MPYVLSSPVVRIAAPLLAVGLLVALNSSRADAVRPVVPEAAGNAAAPSLPPLSPGAAELKFNDFYQAPIGRRGLVMTPKLRSLDGQRVRLLGYMARQEEPLAGVFILAPMSVSIAEIADGPADDLPPAHVFVHMPVDRERAVPYTRGALLLTGTLSVGRQEESDGRVSWVRLLLDPPAPASTASAPPERSR